MRFHTGLIVANGAVRNSANESYQFTILAKSFNVRLARTTRPKTFVSPTGHTTSRGRLPQLRHSKRPLGYPLALNIQRRLGGFNNPFDRILIRTMAGQLAFFHRRIVGVTLTNLGRGLTNRGLSPRSVANVLVNDVCIKMEFPTRSSVVFEGKLITFFYPTEPVEH